MRSPIEEIQILAKSTLARQIKDLLTEKAAHVQWLIQYFIIKV